MSGTLIYAIAVSVLAFIVILLYFNACAKQMTLLGELEAARDEADGLAKKCGRLRDENEHLTSGGFSQFSTVVLADGTTQLYGCGDGLRVTLIKRFPPDPDYPDYPSREARDLADHLNETP